MIAHAQHLTHVVVHVVTGDQFEEELDSKKVLSVSLSGSPLLQEKGTN